VGDLLAFTQSRMRQAVGEFEGKYANPHLPDTPAAEGRDAEPIESAMVPLDGVLTELEFDRYDDFNILSRRAGEIASDMGEAQALLAGFVHAVRSDAARVQQLSAALRGEVTRSRMVPLGRLFARFARPTAAIAFSRQAIIAPYAGMQSLQFRIANRRRRNEIIELEAQVLYTSFETNDRGQLVRRYRLLPLERNKVTFFPLAWTIVHPIDENSPLKGKSRADLERDEAEILVLLTGVDETYEQTVHARTSYRADEIVWHARFQSVFRGISPSHLLSIDVSRLNDIEQA